MTAAAVSEEKYLTFNPFDDEGKGDYRIECRKVLIVTTKKSHPCMASYLLEDANNKGHLIGVGSRAYKENAKVDGHFGTCYSCLPCLEALMKANYE